MNVRHAYAALSALLSFTAALLLAACTDAEKCERGREGCACIDSRPPSCLTSNLSCEDGVCVDDGGGGGVTDDGGMPVDRDAGPPPEIECGDGETLEESCTLFCEAFCQNQERFCVSSKCQPEDCEEGGQVVSVCTSRCSNVACATSLCEDQIDDELTCDDYGVEITEEGTYETLCFDLDPLCVQKAEIGCSDVCGSNDKVGGDYTQNGICEDGKQGDSSSSRCNRGTDCSDCGPHPCAPAGEACVNHGDCCGFYGVGALCVDPDGREGPEAPYCLPTCNDDNPCPEGFRCNPTTGQSEVCVPDN